MGTSWNSEGQIIIDPPLNLAQIKAFRKDCFAQLRPVDLQRLNRVFPNGEAEERFNIADFFALTLEIEQDERETDEGVLQISRAVSLIPACANGGGSSYRMGDQVERAFKIFPDNSFTGEIVAVREQNGGAIKITAKGRKVEEVAGTVHVVWADGSESTDITDL
jgi:hypothetical protein